MTGKCPNPQCASEIKSVSAAGVNIRDGGPGSFTKGVSYACPECGIILSVQVDPLGLKNALIEELVERLKHPRLRTH